MSRIYHITAKSEWEKARLSGIYDRSTLDKSFDEIGFIHASTRDQLEDVANFVYGDSDTELVVLELDIDTLESNNINVKFEDGGNGQMFPHIYSTIPTQLIISVHAAEFEGSILRIK